jgi:hypothetical protein
MTIAMWAVVPEGIVLGADSTSSMFHGSNGFHYFNHNQKVFEVGEDATLGVITWGMGGLPDISWRTLIAYLAEDLVSNPVASVEQSAERWAALVWAKYVAAFPAQTARAAALSAMIPFNPSAVPPDPGARNQAEEEEFKKLRGDLFVGFCVGGYLLPDRTPLAFEVQFFPELVGPPAPEPSPFGFRGAPHFIQRLLNGWDDSAVHAIMQSGKWQGTQAELIQELNKAALRVQVSTLRDTIDFVYSSIHSTIKALKFSDLSQICGGPIELAVISTDRRYRWVRHKRWDSAITDGDVA